MTVPSLAFSKLDRPHFIDSLGIVTPLAFADWKTPEVWVLSLESRKPAGIVLPLELEAPAWPRSHLYGLELLRWLRWSRSTDIRLTPVLALAWQSLDRILRRKPELLVVSSGTYFARLPEAVQTGTPGESCSLHGFVDTVRTAPGRIRASETDLDEAAFGGLGEAARISHHDLANDGYAAWRLWEGYKQALRDADGRGQQALRDRLCWADSETFSWLPELERKCRQPSFVQFQLSRRSSSVPEYPEVTEAESIVRRHAASGPPAGLRILLVDDEFDKGLGEVLLKILFGASGFTCVKTDDDERVSETFYCDDSGHRRWIRLACAKTVRDGVNWLKHWKYIKEEEDSFSSDFYGWVEGWRQSAASSDAPPSSYKKPGNFLRKAQEPYDAPTAPPARPITVVLLDLRLTREEPDVVSDSAKLESLRFRHWLRSQEIEIPVIMLTASRQVLNYAAAMSGAAPHDGWLTKEAPDVLLDNRNSARAVHYLFERLHLYSTRLEWYGDHLGWDVKAMNEYSDLWCDQRRDELLRQVGELSAKIFKEAQRNECEVSKRQQFWDYIKTTVGSATHPFVARLVARRVALACLFSTADWSSGTPSWNLKEYKSLVPHDSRGRGEATFNSVVNFNRDLYIPSGKTPQRHLLREEYDWLMAQDLGAQSKTLNELLRQCRVQAFGADDETEAETK